MCPDGFRTDDAGDSPDDRPYGPRPYGPRPYGPRPYGPRPYGPRPYGPRDEAAADPRPYGPRPYGPRPYGPRDPKPYGPRPYGPRPYGPREEGPGGGFLDPDEWSADIADLFCGGSALIRLGARLIVDGHDLAVPAIDFSPMGARGAYITQPEETPQNARVGTPITTRLKPEARLTERRLRPRDHELAVTVVVPNRLVGDAADAPDLAWALKEDIAHELVLQADLAFLQGAGGAVPLGIVANGAVRQQPVIRNGGATDLLAMARAMIAALRGAPALFRSPGWILSPPALAALAGLRTADGLGRGAGRALDSGRQLTYDNVDGGNLLGYPFIVTPAAGSQPRIFLSADWSEAWIATDGAPVTVDISADARFRSDETVVRATMRHDVVIRRPRWFRHT